MGTTKNGLLRGVSGQVGPVVVANGIDRSIVRIMPKESTKAPKLSALTQRAVFKVATKFVTQTKAVMYAGYQAYKDNIKPLNAALSYHVRNAVSGTYPDFKINPEKVKISKDNGGLKEEKDAAVVAATGTTLNITWDSTMYYTDPELEDRNQDTTLVLVYDETKSITLTAVGAGTRGLSKQSVRLPRVFAGDKVHVYFCFVSLDGKVSNSQYLNTVVVLA